MWNHWNIDLLNQAIKFLDFGCQSGAKKALGLGTSH
jgi:hypothetical protein